MIEPVLKDIFEIPLVDKSKFQYEIYPNAIDTILNKKTFDIGAGNRLSTERMNKLNILIFNKKILNYKKILSNKSLIFNLKFNVSNENKIHLYFYSKLINDLIFKNKNKKIIIITSGIIDIEVLNKYNLDIIFTYNNLKSFNYLFDEIKKKYSLNIVDCTSNTKLSNFILQTNKKYDFIYINNILLNYDYFIPTISLIAKLPLFFFIILNSLFILEENGSIYITFTQGHIFNIPSIQKILCLFTNLFDKYEIINYDNLFLNIQFSNFKGLKNKYKEDIERLIKICNDLDSQRYSQDDLVSCFVSNKFYYNLSIEHDISFENIKKKILFDFDNFNISNDNVNKILNEITSHTNNYYVRQNYYLNIIHNNLNKGYQLLVIDSIFNIFIVLKKNKLLDNILYEKIFEYEINEYNLLLIKLLNTNITYNFENKISTKSYLLTGQGFLKSSLSGYMDSSENLKVSPYITSQNNIYYNTYNRLRDSKTLKSLPTISHIKNSKSNINKTIKKNSKTLKLTDVTLRTKKTDKIFNSLLSLYQENEYIKNIKKELNIENIYNHYKFKIKNQPDNILSKYFTKIIYYSYDSCDNENNKKLKSYEYKIPKLDNISNILDYIKLQEIYISNVILENKFLNSNIILELNNNTKCNYIEWMKQIIFNLLFLLILNKYGINFITTINLIDCDIFCKNTNICLFLTKILSIYSILFKNVYLQKDDEKGLDIISFKIIGRNYISIHDINLINNLMNIFNNIDLTELQIIGKNKRKIILFLEEIIELKNNINIQLHRLNRCKYGQLGKCII